MPQQIAVLGQFDVVLSARLDAAYERADQIYRNACKLPSLLFSVILGVIGGSLVFGGDGYWLVSWNFWLSFIVGLSAAPLAPVGLGVLAPGRGRRRQHGEALT